MRGQPGQSMIQVLVTLLISGILMMAVITSQLTQSRENRALSEKFASLELQKALMTALADGSVCGYVLSNPLNPTAPLTFSYNALSTTPPTEQTITIPSNLAIYASVNAGIPGPVVAQENQVASPLSNTVVVKSIQFVIESCAGTECKAAWRVAFDDSKLVRPLKPISVSTTISVNNAIPASTSIVSCQSEDTPLTPPPTCAAPNVLHYDGTNWSCDAPSAPAGACNSKWNGAPGYTYQGLCCSIVMLFTTCGKFTYGDPACRRVDMMCYTPK